MCRSLGEFRISVVSDSTEASSHFPFVTDPVCHCHRYQWQLSTQFVNFVAKGQPKWHRLQFAGEIESSQDSNQTRRARSTLQVQFNESQTAYNANCKMRNKSNDLVFVRSFYAFESSVAAAAAAAAAAVAAVIRHLSFEDKPTECFAVFKRNGKMKIMNQWNAHSSPVATAHRTYPQCERHTV